MIARDDRAIIRKFTKPVEVAGDGLYMVFRTAADAGLFALELSAMMAGFGEALAKLAQQFYEANVILGGKVSHGATVKIASTRPLKRHQSTKCFIVHAREQFLFRVMESLKIFAR